MENSIQVIDNEQKLLCDVLNELLNEHSEVSVLANSFSVFAYEGLKDSLDRIKSFRFLFLLLPLPPSKRTNTSTMF